MAAITLRKPSVALGTSVAAAITLVGCLLAATTSAATSAGSRPGTSRAAASRIDGTATVTSHAKGATTVLEPGTIVGHRFMKTFELSGGALTLAPFQGATPRLTFADRITLWATDGLSGTIEGVGYADVTVKRSMTHLVGGQAITGLVNVPSLVGLTKYEGTFSCPSETAGEGTKVVPVSQGWYAVILPLDSNNSDVVFSAESNECEHLSPNTVSPAYEDVSINWHLETHATTGTVIVATVPRCGHIVMSGGGGNEFTRQFEYQVEAAVRDGVNRATCSPATDVDEGQNYASSSTTHGFVGPVLNVGPHAGDVVTSAGPRAQPLV
jgi:hypothetical protein